MRGLRSFHANVQPSGRSKRGVRKTILPKFRHCQNSGFVKAGGRHVDGMFDAFSVGEGEDARAVRHDSSIGEETENKAMYLLAIIAEVISC